MGGRQGLSLENPPPSPPPPCRPLNYTVAYTQALTNLTRAALLASGTPLLPLFGLVSRCGGGLVRGWGGEGRVHDAALRPRLQRLRRQAAVARRPRVPRLGARRARGAGLPPRPRRLVPPPLPGGRVGPLGVGGRPQLVLPLPQRDGGGRDGAERLEQLRDAAARRRRCAPPPPSPTAIAGSC